MQSDYQQRTVRWQHFAFRIVGKIFKGVGWVLTRNHYINYTIISTKQRMATQTLIDENSNHSIELRRKQVKIAETLKHRNLFHIDPEEKPP